MRELLNYMESNWILLSLLLAALVCMAVFWNLYRAEKRRAAKAVARVKGERRFYQAFEKEQKSFYLYMDDAEQAVTYVSPNFEKMTGIREELLRADLEVLREVFPSRSTRKLRQELENWDKKSTLEQEIDYHKVGEEEKRHARILFAPDEKRGGYLLSFSDITEEYNIRRQMKQQLGQAQQESQAKTDFLSKMSHEIRTPMNGIIGMLQLAKAHLQDPAAVGEYLDKTENLSQFLLNLINDILDMSRIESGKMELEKEPFDLYELADKLDTMFRGTAEAKGIHWKVELQDMKEHCVVGDEMRLSQVIVNFISNANKFTPSGGSVTVTFREMDRLEDEMHLMIRVKDTGKGIREDFISKIFRPFEQEDASTAHNYGGSGLGMAIADSMIRLMDGQILVDSEEGKGSEFVVYLTLPIAEEEEAAQLRSRSQLSTAKETEHTEKAKEEFSMEGLRILLAEDNDINAEIAMEILKMEGAILTRACDGVEALQMFKESEPGTYDLILMDIQMPQMDGWEATQAIRRTNRPDADLPIFAMSANAFVEDRRHSLEVGMNGHINKPVNFEEVREIIGEYFQTHSAHHS